MGQFKFSTTDLEGLLVIEPRVYGDIRGYFMETYNLKDFVNMGIEGQFVQDNCSRSTKGVLRGLHYQASHSQGKLVRVTKGEVFDVAVDLRTDSRTFAKWYGLLLSEDNKKQLYIPEGFAHGFLVLSDIADFNYKCTDFYDPSSECGLAWNDPTVAIEWPLNGQLPVVSSKDQNWPLLNNAMYLF